MSIGGVIPVLKGLVQKLLPSDEDPRSVHKLKEIISSAMHRHFSKLLGDGNQLGAHHSATWLHPSFKQRYFKPDQAQLVNGFSCSAYK